MEHAITFHTPGAFQNHSQLLRFTVVTLLMACFFQGYSQPLQNLSQYEGGADISSAAKLYYSGIFKAMDDDDMAGSIIDSMFTRNNETRPFYMYLVSTMFKDCDGGLAELISVSTNMMLEQGADNLIEFLYRSDSNVTKYKGPWAERIAKELLLECKDNFPQCIDLSRDRTFAKTKAGNRANLIDFYDKIIKSARAMR